MAAAVSIADGVTTVVSWDVESRDTAALHDNVINPSRLIAPISGIYLYECSARWAFNAAGIRFIQPRANGTSFPFLTAVTTTAVASGEHYQAVTCTVPLAAGEYVEMRVFQSSGAALNLQGGNATYAALTWLGNV
jgi:hypothetical protein